MTSHTPPNPPQQIRWIRRFTSGWPMMDGKEGVPQFGDFQGTIRFDQIIALYPNKRDERFLTITVNGEENDPHQYSMILKSDLHQIAPELAETYPLPKGGQK